MATAVKERQVKLPAGYELWETVTPGRVWLVITDSRGRERSRPVGPGVGSRIRVKTEDRELVMSTNENSAYTNGMLRRVDTRTSEPLAEDASGDDLDREPPTDGGPQALTNEELLEIFRTRHGRAFQGAVSRMTETNVRRMWDLRLEADAKATQITFLRDFIDEHFRAGGSTPTNDELLRSEG